MPGVEHGNSFYSGTSDDERLRHMAQLGINELTLSRLRAIGIATGDTVLDIGSGPHAALGDSIKKTGAAYIALDANPHAARSQSAAEHFAINGSATDLPLGTGTVNVVNARFSMAWIDSENREQAWEEISRVGRSDLRGLISDYDWTVAGGHPEYVRLLDSMRATLTAFGFEPAYGAQLPDDMERFLTSKYGGAAFTMEAIRQPIPAETAEEKLFATRLTVESITGGLRATGQTEQAVQMETQLERVIAADIPTDAMQLPDVVSVSFSVLDPGRGQVVQQQFGRVALAFEGVDVPIHNMSLLHLERGWDGHPLGKKGADLFRRIYLRAGYIDSDGSAVETIAEAIDPAEVRGRSDMFLTLNPDGEAICSVRLIHPNEQGLLSLAIGKKLVETHGREVLPEGVDDHNAAEIGFFAGAARDPLVMIRSIIAAVDTARRSGVDYIVYGAVSGPVERHFNRMFGPALRPVMVEGQVATVQVMGEHYKKEGIPLSVGHILTKVFLEDVIKYYHKLNSKHASHIISLCHQLQQ